MNIKIKSINTNPKAISSVINRYKKNIISKVGYPSTVKSIAYPNGQQVSAVAYDNEFGTSKIPSRPFMKKSVEPSIAISKKLSYGLTSKLNSGAITELQMVKIISQKIVDVHKNTIVEISTPPNSPVTIKKKKSANPLIDTGQMKNSLNYAIVENK